MPLVSRCPRASCGCSAYHDAWAASQRARLVVFISSARPRPTADGARPPRRARKLTRKGNSLSSRRPVWRTGGLLTILTQLSTLYTPPHGRKCPVLGLASMVSSLESLAAKMSRHSRLQSPVTHRHRSLLQPTPAGQDSRFRRLETRGGTRDTRDARHSRRGDTRDAKDLEPEHQWVGGEGGG